MVYGTVAAKQKLGMVQTGAGVRARALRPEVCHQDAYVRGGERKLGWSACLTRFCVMHISIGGGWVAACRSRDVYLCMASDHCLTHKARNDWMLIQQLYHTPAPCNSACPQCHVPSRPAHLYPHKPSGPDPWASRYLASPTHTSLCSLPGGSTMRSSGSERTSAGARAAGRAVASAWPRGAAPMKAMSSTLPGCFSWMEKLPARASTSTCQGASGTPAISHELQKCLVGSVYRLGEGCCTKRASNENPP